MAKRWIIPGVVAVLAATACQPLFSSTASLVARRVSGTNIGLVWNPAFDSDPGESVAYYQVEVNGAVVAQVLAPDTSCLATGLGSGTTYDFSVTAFGNTGQWSGEIGGAFVKLGRLTTSFTTPPGGVAQGTITCAGQPDSDGDRLPDWVENNTKVYVSLASTGTKANMADTDGDGINDGDEALGTLNGLNLPALGTNPLKKNVLMEFDWFDDNLNTTASCTGTPHSHRPTPATIAAYETAFANGDVPNPDGTTGVDVISDYGQGGYFSGGNLIDDSDGVIDGEIGDAEFEAHKAANFAANRHGYFHYVLMPHNYNTNSQSSGLAEYPGDDLIVSMGCSYDNPDFPVANTIMHELGHNLWLDHGGLSSINDKPNYNSVMNYRYQFDGVDTNCTPPGDGLLDFSHGTRIHLQELNLNELIGTCGDPAYPWDWNGDGQLATGVAADVNEDGIVGGQFNDYDDWSLLYFGGLADASLRKAPEKLIQEQPVP